MDPKKELLRQVIEDDTEAEPLNEFRPKFFHRPEDQFEFLDRLADKIIEKYTPKLQELNIDLADEELEQHLLWINDPEQSITGEIATHSSKKSMRAASAYDKLLQFDKATLSFSESTDLVWLELAYLIHTFVPQWLTDGFDAETDTSWLLYISFLYGHLHAGSIDRSEFWSEKRMDYAYRRQASVHRRSKLRSCDHPLELKAYAQEKGNRLYKKHKWTRSSIANDLHADDRLKHIPVQTLISWLTDIPTKSRNK